MLRVPGTLSPLTRVLGWHVKGKELLTGLAEYRNGGLFVDLGVLTLTPAALARATISGQEGDVERVPLFTPDDVAVVEWRALTVALLDRVGDLVRERVCMSASELELAKVLEGGTWKAGREIAAKLRPVTKGPPINLISDGTVF
ncbi:hypothetical protein BC828DRAFT_410622 [Blastocladiella britannica]|nr:hypothetical protein BC828DRAFT_410622 [Blastocladiella britannica]